MASDRQASMPFWLLYVGQLNGGKRYPRTFALETIPVHNCPLGTFIPTLVRYLGHSTCHGHFRECLLEGIAGPRYENRPLMIRKMPFWRERTANDEFWDFSMDVRPVKQLILVD